MTLDKGWILCSGSYASGGMNLAAKGISESVGAELMTVDYPGDGHYGYDKRQYKHTLNIDEVIFGTYEDATGAAEKIRGYNATGAWYIEIQRHSDGSFYKFHNGTTGIKVLWKDIRDIEKKSPGDGQVYNWKKVKLVRSG